MGWDAYREQTFARQQAMGIIPDNSVLTPMLEGAADRGISPASINETPHRIPAGVDRVGA